jgi:two-component system response regulator EvgA
MYKALVVDDHPVVRLAVGMLLQRGDIEVVGETGNGLDAVQLAKSLRPDIVILDISIPKLDGLEVIARLRLLNFHVKVLVLTSQSTASFSARCRQAGASGFITKTEELSDLLDAIKAIRAGYSYFPHDQQVSRPANGRQQDEVAQLATLSDREMMVLIYLAKGWSNIQIADELMLSNKTISTYKTRLLHKLHATTLVDLIEIAKRHALVE